MTEPELELERQKLALERERIQSTLALQKEEAENRQKDRKSEWLKNITPAAATLLVGMVGGFVALFQAQSQAEQQLRLEELKARNGLILQAMQTGDVSQASKNLLFLAKNGIIDLDINKLEQSLEKYQPALPTRFESIIDRYRVPEKLALAEPSQIRSVQIPVSTTTVAPGKFGSRKGQKIVGIVIHNALGPESSVNFLRSGPTPSSLHWIVLPSGEIVPLVDENEAAYHVGRSNKPGWNNSTTIGVAVAGEAPLSKPQQAAAFYRLLADICQRRSLSTSAIITHDAVSPLKKEGLEPHIDEIREHVGKVLSQLPPK